MRSNLKALSRHFGGFSVRLLPRAQFEPVLRPFLDSEQSIPGYDAFSAEIEDVRTWIRIGFMTEKDTGADFRALDKALENIAKSLSCHTKPPISSRDVSVVLGTRYQIEQAAHNLIRFEAMKTAAPPKKYKGINLEQRVAALFLVSNRPDQSYDIAALELRRFAQALETFCTEQNIRPATNSQLDAYAPPAPHSWRREPVSMYQLFWENHIR